MMTGPQNDPTRPAQVPFAMTPVTPGGIAPSPGPARRPGGLTAICVLAIVLGALGLIMGCFGAVSQAFAKQMQNSLAGIQGAGNAEVVELQKEMNAKMLETANKHAVLNKILVVVQLAVAGSLLAGGILSLQLRPFGRTLLLSAFIAAIVFELVRLFPTIEVQRATQAVMAEYMPKLMRAQAPQGNQPQGMDEAMGGIMTMAGVVGMVFSLGMLAVKGVFYLVGIVYLCKSSVAALFVPPPRDTNEWR
jgi:hypothetical protein